MKQSKSEIRLSKFLHESKPDERMIMQARKQSKTFSIKDLATSMKAITPEAIQIKKLATPALAIYTAVNLIRGE
jgi:hypothetical protein